MVSNKEIKVALKYLSDKSDIPEENIKEQLKSKQIHDFEAIKQHLIKELFIGTGTKGWNIYQKGLNYLHRLESTDRQNRDSYFNILSFVSYTLLTLAIITLTMCQLNFEKERSDNEKRLTDAQIAASPPINPRIVIIPEETGKIFAHRLVNVTSSEEEKQKSEAIVFLIKNTGLFDTGRLSIAVDNPRLTSSISYLNNVDGMSANRTVLQFFLVCPNNKNICDYTSVPNGSSEITLRIICEYCEPTFFYKNISICVWRSSYDECNNYVR